MAVSIVLIVVHFAFPMPSSSAGRRRWTAPVEFMALWILGAHLLDLYWLVMPAYGASVTLGWQELGIPLVAAGAAIVVLDGRWVGIISFRGDPKLERGLIRL